MIKDFCMGAIAEVNALKQRTQARNCEEWLNNLSASLLSADLGKDANMNTLKYAQYIITFDGW